MFMYLFGAVFPLQPSHMPANPPKNTAKRSLFLRKVRGFCLTVCVCNLCVYVCKVCECLQSVWMFAKCVWVKKLYFALMWYISTSVFTCHSDKYKHTCTTGINITLIFRATFWPLCNSHPHGNLAGVLFSRPYTLSHTELKNKLCVSTYHGRIFLLAVLTVNYFSTACGLLNILPIQ